MEILGFILVIVGVFLLTRVLSKLIGIGKHKKQNNSSGAATFRRHAIILFVLALIFVLTGLLLTPLL